MGRGFAVLGEAVVDVQALPQGSLKNVILRIWELGLVQSLRKLAWNNFKIQVL